MELGILNIIQKVKMSNKYLEFFILVIETVCVKSKKISSLWQLYILNSIYSIYSQYSHVIFLTTIFAVYFDKIYLEKSVNLSGCLSTHYLNCLKFKKENLIFY